MSLHPDHFPAERALRAGAPRRTRMDFSNLHSGYAWLWGALLALAIVLELIGIGRPGRGDTLSEFWWVLILGWPGALLMAALVWAAMWHIPFRRGLPLGWLDAVFAAWGVAMWLVARHNYGAPALWPFR